MKKSLHCFSVRDQSDALADALTDTLKKKPEKKKGKAVKVSSASSLLKYAGSWHGDDLDQCLEELYLVRGKAEF